MSTKNKFSLRSDNFGGLVARLQDLAHLSDTVKLKFDSDHLLAYSVVANDAAVLCLKAYFLPTADYLDGFRADGLHDLVIAAAPRFVKNLRFFDGCETVRAEMQARPSHEDPSVMHVRSLALSTPAARGDRLRVNLVGAELSKIRDLRREVLAARMDPAKSKWSFSMSGEDLASVRRLSTINSEEKTITLAVDHGCVYVGEDGKWRLQVAETDQADTRLTFAKKHLAHIDQSAAAVEVAVFETFILVAAADSRLLLSFETDFSN